MYQRKVPRFFYTIIIAAEQQGWIYIAAPHTASFAKLVNYFWCNVIALMHGVELGSSSICLNKKLPLGMDFRAFP